MRTISRLLILWSAAVAISCGDGPTPTGPTVVLPSDGGTTVGSGPPPAGPGTATTIGYVEDIKPILDADCIRCHNSRSHDGNVDLSSLASVSRTLRAGDANSLLIRVTRSGGSMNREWRGSASAKADLVRRWIVDFQAREAR